MLAIDWKTVANGFGSPEWLGLLPTDVAIYSYCTVYSSYNYVPCSTCAWSSIHDSNVIRLSIFVIRLSIFVRGMTLLATL